MRQTRFVQAHQADDLDVGDVGNLQNAPNHFVRRTPTPGGRRDNGCPTPNDASCRPVLCATPLSTTPGAAAMAQPLDGEPTIWTGRRGVGCRGTRRHPVSDFSALGYI